MSSGPCPTYLWVISENPPGHPDQFVVHRYLCAFGTLSLRLATPDAKPAAVTDTLDQARAAIPAGAVNLGKLANEDLAIREVWM